MAKQLDIIYNHFRAKESVYILWN